MNSQKQRQLNLGDREGQSSPTSQGGLYNSARNLFSKKFNFKVGSGKTNPNIEDEDNQSTGSAGKKFNSNIPGTKTSQSGSAYYPGTQSNSPSQQRPGTGKLMMTQKTHSTSNLGMSSKNTGTGRKSPLGGYASTSKNQTQSSHQMYVNGANSQKKMFGAARTGTTGSRNSQALHSHNSSQNMSNKMGGVTSKIDTGIRKSPQPGGVRTTGRTSPNLGYSGTQYQSAQGLSHTRHLQKGNSSGTGLNQTSRIASTRTKIGLNIDPNAPQSSSSSNRLGKASSPQNNFIGQGKDENKLVQKLGPSAALAGRKQSSGVNSTSGKLHSMTYDKYSTGSSSRYKTSSRGGIHQSQRSDTNPEKKSGQKSPLSSKMDNVELDDYDEETDEFAGYSGSNANQQSKDASKHAASSQKQVQGQQKQNMASSVSKKSSQQRQREKNIKEIKMYYWTKVDSGDQNEVFKILSYAKQQFNQGNELFEIVNCTNSDGFTPLHLAASEGHAPLIEILMKFKAQVDARTNNFRTPLHIACLRGNLSVIQALIQHGADINAKDIDGNTPCHFASEYGHRYCLKFLLTRQPYLFANNNEDKSAIDVAINNEILTEFQEFITQSKDVPKKDKQASQKVEKPVKSEASLTEQKRASEKSNNLDVASNKSGRSAGGVSRMTNKSNLSQNTRIRNQVTKVKKQMNEKAEAGQEEDALGAKVAQITIGGRKEEQKIQKSKVEGIPDVQEVDDNYKSSYGQDNFLPLKKLGSGSFGDVYLVRDKNSGKLYAMKTLSKRKILGQNLVRYAKTERDVLSYMLHPFIVNLKYAFQTKTKLFLILQFCPGGDLGKVIAHERRFQEDRARLYIAEILLALQDLHKRDIIYRDLKPDNVVLDDDGHALLTDFGLSKEGVLEVNKGAKSFCGSIAYLAPEMLRRVGHGKSVDWYLLGVLLYEMLVGSPPYFSGNKEELFHNIINGPLKLPRSISTEAKNLMVSLLNRNPTKRLGAGPEGAHEIMKHPFFKAINWDDVLMKRTNPPKPRLRSEHFNHQYPYSEFSKGQIQEIFDDEKEIKREHEIGPDGKVNAGTQNVDGWSFIKMTESHIEMQKDIETNPPNRGAKTPQNGQYSVAGNNQMQNN